MPGHDRMLQNFKIKPGIKQIFRTGRWLRSRFSKGVLILLYHRVAQTDHDPFSLCVTPGNFNGHMEYLRNYTHPISFQEMLESFETGELPKGAVVITFDDGYADNLYNAQPVLERYHIPATFFIVSGCIDKSFWWEDLTQIMYQPFSLPNQLSLTIQNHAYTWKMNDSGTPARRNLFKSLFQLSRSVPTGERTHLLKELKAWSAVTDEQWQERRPLTAGELLELAAKACLEIGAHTVNHPLLADLPLSGQEQEIIESKFSLEKLLEKPVISFSYPYGLNSDYTSKTIFLVKKAGFHLACSNFAGLAGRKSDRYQLPRLWIKDWDKTTFARRVNRWLAG